jgi:hypothetical protein
MYHLKDLAAARIEGEVVIDHQNVPVEPYVRFHIGDVILFMTPAQLAELRDQAQKTEQEWNTKVGANYMSLAQLRKQAESHAEAQ